MTRSFEGERTLMRIFIGETDRCPTGPHKGLPLYEALLLTFREEGCIGATVVRAIAGFGASHELHTGKVLRLSTDLPVIVEVVDDEENLQRILPTLDELMGGGIITMEKARVVMYRAAESTEGS